MLQILAIVVGVLAAATRLMGVIFPGFVKKLLKLLLEEKGPLLFGMVYAAVLGALFVWGFRLEYAALNVWWQANVLLILGIVMVLVALRNLAWPQALFTLLGRISEMSPTGVRLLCLLGAIFGGLLTLLGLSMSCG
jgi:hypothetical protein